MVACLWACIYAQLIKRVKDSLQALEEVGSPSAPFLIMRHASTLHSRRSQSPADRYGAGNECGDASGYQPLLGNYAVAGSVSVTVHGGQAVATVPVSSLMNMMDMTLPSTNVWTHGFPNNRVAPFPQATADNNAAAAAASVPVDEGCCGCKPCAWYCTCVSDNRCMCCEGSYSPNQGRGSPRATAGLFFSTLLFSALQQVLWERTETPLCSMPSSATRCTSRWGQS